MSGAAVVHRRGLLLPAPAVRILFAGGLAMAGWLCAGAVLSTPASAGELPPSGPGTVVVQPAPWEEPAADEPSEQPATEEPATEEPTAEEPAAEEPSAEPEAPAEEATEPGEPTTPAETPSGSGSAEAEKPATPEPAPAPAEEPEAAVETMAASSTNSVETKTSSTSKPSKKAAENAGTNTGGGLLGGLLGSVLNVVTTTVGGVVETVGGVVGTVNEQVLVPIVTPGGPCEPGKPEILPILDEVLEPVFGGSAGATVTVTVPVREIVTGETAPAMPDPRPLVPASAPAPATTPHHRVAFPVQVQLDVQSTPAAPAESDTNAAPHGGGGSGGGGGGLPNAPVAPAAPTTSAHPGHDSSGGGRGPLAVLDSGMPATQLKLIGAGCDHEGERTGREAALPTTSPD